MLGHADLDLRPRNALRPDHDLTQEQWTHVLKLATMWDFDDVRQLAVSKMGKMEMSRDQRFRLGRAYSVSKVRAASMFLLIA